MTVSLPVSSTSLSAGVRRVDSPRVRRLKSARALRAHGGAVPAALAAVLMLVAVVVAPEKPQVQEAICQRHNGAEACRVW